MTTRSDCSQPGQHLLPKTEQVRSEVKHDEQSLKYLIYLQVIQLEQTKSRNLRGVKNDAVNSLLKLICKRTSVA